MIVKKDSTFYSYLFISIMTMLYPPAWLTTYLLGDFFNPPLGQCQKIPTLQLKLVVTNYASPPPCTLMYVLGQPLPLSVHCEEGARSKRIQASDLINYLPFYYLCESTHLYAFTQPLSHPLRAYILSGSLLVLKVLNYYISDPLILETRFRTKEEKSVLQSETVRSP